MNVLHEAANYIAHRRLRRASEILPDQKVKDQAHVDGHFLVGANSAPNDAMAAEELIKTKAMVVVDQSRQHAAQELDRAKAAIYRLNASVSDFAFGDDVDSMKNDVARLLSTATTALDGGVSNIRKKLEAYENFKRENDLIGCEPIYDDTIMRTLCILLLFAVFETAITLTLYAEVNSAGLAGGTLVALMVSVANVGSSFMAGFLAREINHVRRHRVIAGWIATCLLVPVIIAAHAIIALYRYDLGGHEDPIAPIALFAVGTVGFYISVRKGYLTRDRYPGFAAVHQALVRAIQDATKIRAGFIDDLEAASDVTARRLAKRLRLLDRTAVKAYAVIDVAAACIKHVENLIDRLQERHRYLQKLRRQHVCRLAGSRTEEAYRNIPLPVLDVSLQVSSEEILAAKRQLQAAADGKRQEADDCLAAIRSCATEAIRQLNAYAFHEPRHYVPGVVDVSEHRRLPVLEEEEETDDR